jgi:hypothetical protein
VATPCSRAVSTAEGRPGVGAQRVQPAGRPAGRAIRRGRAPAMASHADAARGRLQGAGRIATILRRPPARTRGRPCSSPRPPVRHDQLAAALPDERHPVLLGRRAAVALERLELPFFDHWSCSRGARARGRHDLGGDAALRRRWPGCLRRTRRRRRQTRCRPSVGLRGLAGATARGELERLPARAAPDADVPDLPGPVRPRAGRTGRHPAAAGGRASETRGRQVLADWPRWPRAPRRCAPPRGRRHARDLHAPPTRPRCAPPANTSSTATSTR